MNIQLEADRDMKQAIAYADSLNPLLERIFAPASADDKRVKAAKKCLETKPQCPSKDQRHNCDRCHLKYLLKDMIIFRGFLLCEKCLSKYDLQINGAK